MKTRIILTILSLFTLPSVAQPLTMQYVESWIDSCDNSILSTDKELLFVIDGIPIKEEAINEELAQIDIGNKYLTIDYFDSNTDHKEAGTIDIKPNLVVIIIRRNLEKTKNAEIKKVLEDARELFVDDYSLYSTHIMEDAKDPAFIIDQLAVKHSDSRKRINSIRSRQIKSIVILGHAPQTIYGQNAKNGLVSIWLK